MKKKILKILKEGKKCGYNNEAIANELLNLFSASQQRELLEAYSDKFCSDLGLDFDNQDEYIDNFLASNCG